jgi:hypothetical protein
VSVKLLHKNYHHTKHDILQTIKTHIAAFAEGGITSKNKKHEKITKVRNEKSIGW